MLGVLGSPVVTLMWAFEQIDIHIFGGTARASDIRIFISTFINAAFIVSIEMEKEYDSSFGYKGAIIMQVILAFFSSHNVLLNLGVIKPFRVVNEKLLQ